MLVVIPQLHFKLHSHRIPGASAKGWNDAIRSGLRMAAEHWLKWMMPEHFTTQGARKYQYPPIGSRYLSRKLNKTRVFDYAAQLWVHRQKGHIPLVWTGAMRASLLQRPPSQFNIRTTSTQNRVRLQIPLRVQGGAPKAGVRMYGKATVWEPLTKLTKQEIVLLTEIVLTEMIRFYRAGGTAAHEF